MKRASSPPWIEAIRIFLAFASYMGFIVYQMDVKSALLYGKINEEVYVSQPLGFIDPKYPKKVYISSEGLYGYTSSRAARSKTRRWYLYNPAQDTSVLILDLETPSDSDYAGANLDRKSTTGGRNSVAAANCYGQSFMDSKCNFHEVIDFLVRSSIHHALTVSPVVSTTFVEQFWMSAKSKIINNVRYITAKVAGKPVSISEASIRSDLLFDDADGIDSLPN
ncbi:putative ribonuclease H-like domain-containing protein [Tanacetum coccineum]